jgi:hypothetical protein
LFYTSGGLGRIINENASFYGLITISSNQIRSLGFLVRDRDAPAVTQISDALKTRVDDDGTLVSAMSTVQGAERNEIV